MIGRDIRLKKLFSKDENAVVVAIDHGEFDGPLAGMVNLPDVARSIIHQVDGILLSPGMLRHCQDIFNYRGAPLAIVRLNWSTVYCFRWKYHQAVTVPAISPKEAGALGADIVLVSLTLQTGSEETDARNVEVFCKLVNEARNLGIPVIGEYFPVKIDSLNAKGLYEEVYAGCRIISELGADLIKTFYTQNFSKVVEACPIPILGLGAEKTPKEIDALILAKKEIDAGAKGVVFGRNVMQAKNPSKFMSSLCEVVKYGKDPHQIAKKFGLE